MATHAFKKLPAHCQANYLRKSAALFLLVLLSATACTKQEDPDRENYSVPTNAIVVGNEGLFNQGNASISVLNLDSQAMHNDLFQRVNQYPLGDVLHSMTRVQDKLFLVVNNSQKIEVVDARTLEQKATIAGLGSPRQLLALNDSKGYVSDLYAKGIHIVDLKSYTKIGFIPYMAQDPTLFSGWTESMVLHDGLVYCAAPRNKSIIVIDAAKDQIIDSISTASQPIKLVKNASQNQLYVLCNGNLFEEYSYILTLDLKNRSVVRSVVFPSVTDNPTGLCYSENSKSLIFINKDLYSMPASATNYNPQRLLLSEGNYFYSLYLNPVTDDILVGDARDFIQNGRIYHLKASNSERLGVYDAGVAPSSYLFLP